MEGIITHNLNYQNSSCKLQYRTKHWKKTYTCDVCGANHSTKTAKIRCEEKCEKSHQEKVWKEKQIEKNFKIINHAPERIRRELAIYRLYRYCDLSPKHITFEISASKNYVQNVIGRVFKLLCLSNSKCVFQKYFTKTHKVINNTKSIVEQP